MIEFAKKIAFDALMQEHPAQTLIIKTDDMALVKAITATVQQFSNARKVIEEATLPAEDARKLVVSELSLFSENSEDNKVKASRNVAKRHVEAVFEDFPQSVPFRTLGELYKWMTGKDTSRAGCPATHLRMLNKKRLANRPKIVNIIRMDVAGREYTNRKAN